MTRPFQEFALVRLTTDRLAPRGTLGILRQSYKEQFGGNHGERDFTIFIHGHGDVSWISPDEMELLDLGREDLLKQWKHDCGFLD